MAFTAALVYLPPLQQLFGTAALGPGTLAVIAPFPFVVWGLDELRRLNRARTAGGTVQRPAMIALARAGVTAWPSVSQMTQGVPRHYGQGPLGEAGGSDAQRAEVVFAWRWVICSSGRCGQTGGLACGRWPRRGPS